MEMGGQKLFINLKRRASKNKQKTQKQGKSEIKKHFSFKIAKSKGIIRKHFFLKIEKKKDKLKELAPLAGKTFLFLNGKKTTKKTK